ncbi:hypothetical protein DUNSADRAFT_13300 [Dunaliella salina]|uniref:Uncharacterized protein n=1 Tax=Dunaliella salina TaxID=3046 RepID=A0ABQ7G9Q7_DUNSA|nr:hypothetical protein DUNSADRAFT_13300 [Dunaliella salina]|eukprot:KAF5831326.1 hypothetical protein DUNSADRAFT_13300 [Dunaliella salina]
MPPLRCSLCTEAFGIKVSRMCGVMQAEVSHILGTGPNQEFTASSFATEGSISCSRLCTELTFAAHVLFSFAGYVLFSLAGSVLFSFAGYVLSSFAGSVLFSLAGSALFLFAGYVLSSFAAHVLF